VDPPLPGGVSPWAAPEPEFVPILGQSLVEPEEDDPVEPLGVELVDPDEPLVLRLDGAVLELPEPVPVDPVLVLVAVEPELVAALAASAPPATSPLVNAPMASALRTRSFMMCPF
jgi:hypothetical protein